MDRYSFPTKSILVAATAIGIASVATPVRAANYYGLAGSVCAAVQANGPKLSVPPIGQISNKSTTASALIQCPMAAGYNLSSLFYVTWNKKDSQSLSCVLHRRAFDYLSGATNTQSTTFVGSGNFQFGFLTSDYFNSFQCTIPRNNGAGQNFVNGVIWYQ
jgi:hypothetical protein